MVGISPTNRLYTGNTIMSNFTVDMIKQALMINPEIEVRANIDRDRLASHSQILQAFITPQTRSTNLRMAYLPKDKPLDIIDVLPVNIHNATSQPQYRNRLGYVTSSNRQRIDNNADNSITLHNSNPKMVADIRATSIGTHNSPWNSMFVIGHFRLTPVPSEINDANCVAAYNAVSAKLIKTHLVLVANLEASGIDVGSSHDYRTHIEPLYEEYQENMMRLIEAGYVSLTQAIVAEPSKIIPALTNNSGANHSNPFMNAREITKECSYIPTLNEFFGTASIISSAEHDDMNPELQLGMRDLGKGRGKGEQDDSERGSRKACSRLASVSDSLGNTTTIIVRRMDAGYTSNNTKSLSESFESNTKNNQTMMIRGKYAPMAMENDSGANTNGLARVSITVDEYRTIPNTSLSAKTSMVSNYDLFGIDTSKDVETLVAEVGEATFNLDAFLGNIKPKDAEVVNSATTSVADVKPSAGKRDIL